MIASSLVAVLLASAPAAAAGPYELEHHLIADSVATGVLGAGWLLSETVLKPTLAPARCRWCEPPRVDTWARGIRAQNTRFSATLSDVVAFGALPVAAFGTELIAAPSGDFRTYGLDALFIVQTTMVALALTQATKFAVGRERPFVHALPPAEKPFTDHPEDNNLSFFSGHSSFSFAVATSAGTIAELRGYRQAWLVWAVCLPLAALPPVLRMVSDRHYLTDVLVGSAVGAATGLTLPRLLHPRAGRLAPVGRFRLVPAGNGVALLGQFD